VAQAFAELGDQVAVHHRGSPGLAEQVRAGLPGGGHTVVQADLADAEAVRRMVDRAHADLGGLDVLVNNAGIYVSHPITDVSYQQWQDAWRDTLAVNLTGAANVTWCAVQYMKETGGRIVNVTSRGAYRGEPRHPAYGASKAGLNAFGQSMARALAPLGIAVATVAPGYVETDMALGDLNSSRGDEIRAQSPFNRVATPAEIAAAVIYLASTGAEWASGAILDLNGASYLRLESAAGWSAVMWATLVSRACQACSVPGVRRCGTRRSRTKQEMSSRAQRSRYCSSAAVSTGRPVSSV
jgi:3-oxoacyl-[acyl-carrier protein] reductase